MVYDSSHLWVRYVCCNLASIGIAPDAFDSPEISESPPTLRWSNHWDKTEKGGYRISLNHEPTVRILKEEFGCCLNHPG